MNTLQIYPVSEQTVMSKEEALEKTHAWFKKNNINKTLDRLYEEFVENKKTKEMKIITNYLKTGGLSANPYHIYNQFLYYKGLP